MTDTNAEITSLLPASAAENIREEHVWLSDEYSVPASSLCLWRAPSPNADHFCTRQKDHKGGHQFFYARDGMFRNYAWNDPDGKSS